MSEVISQELDFGQSRRFEAQLALRSVLGRVEREPFTGCRLKEGEVAVEFENQDEAAAHLQAGLVAFLEGLGAGVAIVPAGAEAAVQTPPEDAKNYAPFETVLVHGTVPGNALEHGRKATVQIMEACAEIIRVLLGTAVVAATEDCAEGERVVVLMRRALELDSRIDFASGRMTGIAMARCIVFTENEPRASYLLGSAYGQPKPYSLEWGFPLVEEIYGPNRLRWQDLRSPGYEPAAVEQGVAS